MSDLQAFYEFVYSVRNHVGGDISLHSTLALWDEVKCTFESAQKRIVDQVSALDQVARTAPQVRAQMDAGDRIKAIRELRAITKCGLKEAKDSIDRVYHH